jgi:hypothetical protein
MANMICKYRPAWRRDAPNLEQRVALRGRSGGYLNPTWIGWLMGFPSRWLPLNSGLSETRLSQLSENSSDD